MITAQESIVVVNQRGRAMPNQGLGHPRNRSAGAIIVLKMGKHRHTLSQRLMW